MDNPNSAKKLMEGNRIYYTFIRPHQSLNGKTPAEMANLDLGLGRNKWRGLVEKAVEPQRNGAH